MPIKIPNNLPAAEILNRENIFFMTETRAMTQDIRALRVLIMNLMPTKIETETQFARVLGNSPIQIELELIAPSNREFKNTSHEHMLSFYKTFDDVKDQTFDGLIITGAPVEHLEFEEVDYWDELVELMDWSKVHVHSTLYVCWGAQAGLYHHYGIKKVQLDKQLFGVFPHHVERENYILFRGMDDEFYIPHSRHTTILREDVDAVPELTVMASSDEAGIYAIKTDNGREIYLFGHAEYDWDTLKKEYDRDTSQGKPIEIPKNYYPGDDPTKPPIVRWRSCGHLIYSNWINYFLYQTTPYDITHIKNNNQWAFPPAENNWNE